MVGVEVRRADGADVDWIVDQLKDFSDFHDSKYALFGDIEHAAKIVGDVIENHVVFVAHGDGKLMGFISGYLIDHPYNPKIKTLNEQFWWVPEEYRGTGAGALLLKSFNDYGKKVAHWIIMALESNSPVKEDSLVKRGYRLHERSYLMEV